MSYIKMIPFIIFIGIVFVVEFVKNTIKYRSLKEGFNKAKNTRLFY
jgi:hypothetical protein